MEPTVTQSASDLAEHRSGVEHPAVDAAAVMRVRAALPIDPEVAELAATFKLLGDPTRIKLLHALLAADELCVCDLAEVTGTAESTVSQALRLLRTAEVVIARRAGRQIFYRLQDAHVRELLTITIQHVRHEGHVHDQEQDS